MLANDLIFTFGSIVFLVALIPSLVSENKPDKKTSFITSFVLCVFSLNYISIGLYFSSVVSFIGAIAWLVLYIQKKKGNKIASDFST